MAEMNNLAAQAVKCRCGASGMYVVENEAFCPDHYPWRDRSKDEVNRFRAALEKIAAPFDSGPATFVQAHMIASEELKRRMQIAADALS